PRRSPTDRSGSVLGAATRSAPLGPQPPCTNRGPGVRSLLMANLRLFFGAYELGPAGGLRCDGRPVALRPRHLAVLRCLALRSGKVVSTDEILDTVWGDTFVSRGVVKVAVRHVRVALGDTLPSATFIETVGRHGYRFVAPVRTETMAAA